ASVGTLSARSSFSVRASASRSTSASTRLIPSAANRLAKALPKPLPAPVTTATLPANSSICQLLVPESVVNDPVNMRVCSRDRRARAPHRPRPARGHRRPHPCPSLGVRASRRGRRRARRGGGVLQDRGDQLHGRRVGGLLP